MNVDTVKPSMTKYDVFVMIRRTVTRMVMTPIELKLMHLFWERLVKQGFGNVTFDIRQPFEMQPFTEVELEELKASPFFLSEHYLIKKYRMDWVEQCEDATKVPFRMRPTLDAYTYTNYGKPPKFHFMFVGKVNTGKTILLTEFKNMLKEISSDIEIIHCENEIDQIMDYDKVDYDKHHNHFLNGSKHLSFCIGGSPTYRINVDGTREHNTKI